MRLARLWGCIVQDLAYTTVEMSMRVHDQFEGVKRTRGDRDWLPSRRDLVHLLWDYEQRIIHSPGRDYPRFGKRLVSRATDRRKGRDMTLMSLAVLDITLRLGRCTSGRVTLTTFV
jgi:hypothetical protein